MIFPAISTPVAFSIPCNPGEELTSKTNGPRSDCNKSTPATPNPRALAARIAVYFSSTDNSMFNDVWHVCNGNSISLVFQLYALEHRNGKVYLYAPDSYCAHSVNYAVQ